MKTKNTQIACNCQNTQAKTGFISAKKILNALHLNNTTRLTAAGLRPKTISWASTEAEETYQIEAELRRESARTNAYPYLIR